MMPRHLSSFFVFGGLVPRFLMKLSFDEVSGHNIKLSSEPACVYPSVILQLNWFKSLLETRYCKCDEIIIDRWLFQFSYGC